MYKRKMSFEDIIHLGIEYFAFRRVKCKNGLSGYLYVLDKPLSDGQRKAVSGYKNTVISTCTYRYAPEIKHDSLIILNKCIR